MRRLVLFTVILSLVCANFSFTGSAFVTPTRTLEKGAGPDAWIGDLSPITKTDWNYARAGHLLERAGFGGTPEEIEKLARMTPEQAVNYLVDYDAIADKAQPFEESGIWDEAMLKHIDAAFNFSQGLAAGYHRGDAYGVKPNPAGTTRRLQPVVDQLYYRLFAHRFEWTRASLWWANRMLATKRPLEEKLTLFWHGHFATEDAKVADYRLMLNQLELLRRNATGNFRNLLVGITRDAAMLIYLDNRQNVKGHANENYAREILELFSLGVGNYTENDIKEAARAFTGWTNAGPKTVYKTELHDEGVKTFLGEKGNFNDEQIVDIILKQKVAAEFITRKLYRFLVREDLTPELNARLAARLRESKYEFKPLLKTIFLSKDFHSPAAYATQIKSPVHLAVSTYKKLGLTEVPGRPYFPIVTTGLGQTLGNPPNVKGWDGGKTWINPSTMLQRANFARELLFPETASTPALARIIPERYANADKEAEDRDKQAAALQTGSPEAMMANVGEPMTASKMINSVPDYDLKLGVYRGYQKTFQRVKPVPPTPASLNLKAMAKGANLKTADQTVDYFVLRLLRLPLSAKDRAVMVEFLNKQWGGAEINYSSDQVEHSLRELVHLIMSTPEYQLV